MASHYYELGVVFKIGDLSKRLRMANSDVREYGSDQSHLTLVCQSVRINHHVYPCPITNQQVAEVTETGEELEMSGVPTL